VTTADPPPMLTSEDPVKSPAGKVRTSTTPYPPPLTGIALRGI